MPMISSFRFPSPNWHLWKGEKDTTTTNKDKILHTLSRKAELNA